MPPASIWSIATPLQASSGGLPEANFIKAATMPGFSSQDVTAVAEQAFVQSDLGEMAFECASVALCE